jgi:hypothetical protein
MKVFIKSYQFENISISDIVLKKCLKLNLLVYDRSPTPDKSTEWLPRLIDCIFSIKLYFWQTLKLYNYEMRSNNMENFIVFNGLPYI